jgi:hypothetical protein
VDPVPESLLLRKSGSAGNRTRTSGCDQEPLDHRGGLGNTVLEHFYLYFFKTKI